MWETIKNWAMTQGLELGTNILVAVIILVIGILLCKLIMKIVDAALKKSKMDPAAHALIKTLTKSIIYIMLALVVASALGIDITGIVALASVATLAISLSIQDLLSNVIGGLRCCTPIPSAPVNLWRLPVSPALLPRWALPTPSW
jgi:small conductance mechanosensitive channel